jgi:hypothetical protein
VTLLSGIRNLITRRKPPLALDDDEPQQDGAVEHEEADVSEPVETVGQVVAIEPKPEIESAPEASPSSDSGMAVPGVDVVAAVENIGDRIEAQGDRLEAHSSDVRKLTRHMEQLRLVLKEAAEIKGLCAQVIEFVSGQGDGGGTRAEALVEAVDEIRRHEGAVMEAISESRTRDDAVIKAVDEAVNRAVAAAVERLSEASSREAGALGRIQEQLVANARALHEAEETQEGIVGNLGEVLESSNRVQRVVANLAQAHEQREAQMAAQLAASKRTMLLLAFACTLTSLLALVVAVVALIM